MRFRNSVRLLLNNFKSTYVILLFRLVVFLITGSLAAVILAANIGPFLESPEADAFVTALEDIVATFFNSPDFSSFDAYFREAMDALVQAIGGIFAFMNRHLAEIVFSCIGLILLYLVNSFLNGLALFAFGDILNDKMSQFTETPFFAGFLRNIGPAALYQVVYVPISFAYDVLVLVVCYLVFFRLFVFLPVFLALFFGATFIIAMHAVKLALISDWMPSIIVGSKKLTQAMRESFRMGRKQFAANFSNYLVAVYCIVAINVVFALTTFFSALLITVPASYIFVICLQFVGYYSANGKRYFLSCTNICDPENPEGGVYIRIADKPAAPAAGESAETAGPAENAENAGTADAERVSAAEHTEGKEGE